MSAPESHTSADEALSGLMSAVIGSPEYSRLAAPPAGAQEPIGAHDLRTTKGGRGYVAEYVIKRLGRHDFTRYINEALAADFACALANHLAALPAPAAGDALELKRKTDLIGELSKIIHNMTVAQQAAWIEWQHGAGADAAMQWIENGLAGPGHVPDEDEPYGTEAQAYFDANQADPFPACHCGRPSNILHMGSGYCSDEHYRAALSSQSAHKQGASDA